METFWEESEKHNGTLESFIIRMQQRDKDEEGVFSFSI